MHTGRRQTRQVLAGGYHGAPLANSKLLEANGQVVQVDHGDAGLDKRPHELHCRRETAETHVGVGDEGLQEVIAFELGAVCLGVAQAELLLALVVPQLRLEDLVHDLGHGVPWVVGMVVTRVLDLGQAAESTRDVDGLDRKRK